VIFTIPEQQVPAVRTAIRAEFVSFSSCPSCSSWFKALIRAQKSISRLSLAYRAGCKAVGASHGPPGTNVWL